MSTTVDNRVLEMRFDNRQFESNVSTSMSTLEKLKQKLNLSGASKGLENVGSEAKKVNFSGMQSAMDTVHAKFSAMQVIGVTALTNIINSAINAGKRMVSALTIDPIKTGFQEYETQINSVQTILANTQSKGTTLDQVNAALDELNKYADLTIYNFTEMTRNIGTFTAAGVDLDTSVSAIQGIANLAAVSGSTSQQASTAMYQLSQALATGTVKLMDWNSVVNAGMGGQVFQDALKETSKLLGTGAEAAIEANGSFRESLQTGWLTSEVLTETLKKFTTSGANEYVAKYTGLSEETVKTTLKNAEAQYGEAEAIDKAADSLAKKSGKSKDEIKSALQMAKNAEDAATKVKTFSQLWDTMKEAAQSGWTQTWELMIGDFEEAKEFLTELSDLFNGIIGKSANARNRLLGGALNSNYDKIINKVGKAGITAETFEEKIKNIAKESGIDNVDEIIVKYGSLEKAFQEGAISSDILTKALSSLSTGTADLSKVTKDLKIGDVGEDVKQVQTALQDLGYDLGEFGIDGKLGQKTEEAVKAFQELSGLEVTGIVDEETVEALEKANARTKDLTGSCKKLIKNIDKIGGRELLIDSLRNTFEAVSKVVNTVKDAWKEVFPPATSKQLYSTIERLKEFTKNLKISEETAGKLKRVFKGVFSIFSIAGKIVKLFGDALLSLARSDGITSLSDFLLDIAASIGDFFTSINEGFDTNGLVGVLSAIADWISDFVKRTVGGLSSFGDAFSTIGSFVVSIAKNIWNAIKTVFTWITDNVSGGDVFAGLAGAGLFVIADKIAGAFDFIKDTFSRIVGIFKGNGASSIKESFCDILDSVHDSLQSFSIGIKAGTLITIAIAVGILSASLKTISELKSTDISKSITAIGFILGELIGSFRALSKSLTKFKSKGIVKSGAALILIAKAIDILADSMVKLSDLSLWEIAKGLTAVGGSLGELSAGIRAIGATRVPISTSVAVLALAKSCEMLSDSLAKFGKMQWDEIGRSLTAMGGALGELVSAISVLGKTGGIKSLIGSVGILITVQSLEKMAEGLKNFAEMSWDEIGRGLTAMGGALGELGMVLGGLGKLAGFSSIFASGSILITVQGLDDLANALKKFGKMQWDEIGRGLTAMGGALSEVAVVSGALGKLTGLSGILGSGAILLGVQSLAQLADGLKSFGSMTWDEIVHGLVGMGGALSEVAVVSGALGKLTGLSGILGSGAILLGVQSLAQLADGLKSFGSMTWDEIVHGLVGMGGALSEVAVVSGALGSLAGLPALLGSGAILLAIQGLGDLADALKKFGSMSWDEIGRGLTAMGGALGEIALGGFLNTLSIIGSYSISEVAEPLGVLADSVKKWENVTVPEGLGLQLGSLADGILSFTFGGFGASAIAEVAAPLGTLSDSVKKWTGVIIPEGLGDQLKSLSVGVESFTFGGFGASAIAEVAAPLGTLADSVKKWTGVTLSDELENELTSLSNGVKSFTWAFVGGWSIGSIIEPLGTLPESVKKWNDVKIPEGLEDGLKSLSNGVEAFTWAFVGGWSIGAINESLGSLAGSVKKWNGVKIPEGLEDGLASLADGVEAFTWAFVGGWSIGAIAEPLGSLAESVKKWNGVKIPKNIGDNLDGLASGLDKFSDVGDVSSATKAMESVASSAAKLSGINFNMICSGMSSLSTAFKNISNIDTSGVSSLKTAVSSINKIASSMVNSASKFTSVGSKIAESIVKGFKSKQSSFTSAVSNMISSGLRSITNKTNVFDQAGTTLNTKLVTGLNSKLPMIKASLIGAISLTVSAIRAYWNSFYDAGNYLGDGLIAGINSKKTDVRNAGLALGQTAVEGEKDGQQSQSPSKLTVQAGKWLGEGLIIGINQMSSKVYSAGHGLGDSAAKSMSSAISKVSDVIDSGMDAQPTIRPVVDLSNVRTGVNAIGNMFNLNPSVGTSANLNAISSMMSTKNQNGQNQEVVSAIDKLRKELRNTGRNSYNINGITYDDGSNVSNAVSQLIRAIRIEGRV